MAVGLGPLHDGAPVGGAGVRDGCGKTHNATSVVGEPGYLNSLGTLLSDSVPRLSPCTVWPRKRAYGAARSLWRDSRATSATDESLQVLPADPDGVRHAHTGEFAAADKPVDRHGLDPERPGHLGDGQQPRAGLTERDTLDLAARGAANESGTGGPDGMDRVGTPAVNPAERLAPWTPWDPMERVEAPGRASQAEGRGFDPRLPLWTRPRRRSPLQGAPPGPSSFWPASDL